MSGRVARATDGAPAVVLGHGAGSDLAHPHLVALQETLPAHGYAVVTYNFPYRDARRRFPDRRPTLDGTARAVLDWTAATLAPAGRGPSEGASERNSPRDGTQHGLTSLSLT